MKGFCLFIAVFFISTVLVLAQQKITAGNASFDMPEGWRIDVELYIF